MAGLDGFSVITFGGSGPLASITRNGVTFNKAVVDRMGNTQYVLLLLDESTRRFAIQKCAQNTPQSMPFVAAIKASAPSVRWGSKELLKTIKRLTGWPLDARECKGFKVPGQYLKSEGAMIFDLLEAIPII